MVKGGCIVFKKELLLIVFTICLLFVNNIDAAIVAESVYAEEQESLFLPKEKKSLRQDAVFSVTVPTNLPLSVSDNGKVSVASNIKIKNNSSGPVEIKNIKVLTQNGWRIQPWDTNFYRRKVGLKEFSLKLNGSDVSSSGDVSISNFNTIPCDDYIPLFYSGKVATQERGIGYAKIADVVFTIGWTDDYEEDLTNQEKLLNILEQEIEVFEESFQNENIEEYNFENEEEAGTDDGAIDKEEDSSPDEKTDETDIDDKEIDEEEFQNIDDETDEIDNDREEESGFDEEEIISIDEEESPDQSIDEETNIDDEAIKEESGLNEEADEISTNEEIIDEEGNIDQDFDSEGEDKEID